jgi:hypothetical protein
VVFLTDARSALQALQSRKLLGLQLQLSHQCNQQKVTLQWIPSQCGVPGNEKVDRLAKEGAREEQPDSHVTYHQRKRMIRSIRKPPASIQDDYQIMTRQEQAVIFCLKTGHNRLREHMYTKFKIGNSAMCTCEQAPQTAEHILQDSSEYDILRQTQWPRQHCRYRQYFMQ